MGLFAIILSAHLTFAEAPKVEVIKVKGMVCELCAQGIKKKLKSQDEVESVEVIIKDHVVKVAYKDPEKRIPTERLAALLKDAGYELDSAR